MRKKSELPICVKQLLRNISIGVDEKATVTPVHDEMHTKAVKRHLVFLSPPECVSNWYCSKPCKRHLQLLNEISAQ